MLVLQKAALKGTFKRNYAVDLGDYYGWGNLILNKDLTQTSLDRVFNPCYSITDDYENSFIGWSKQAPFFLSGCNGVTSQFAGNNQYHPNHLSNCYAMDYEFKPYFDSQQGITTGKRYVCFHNTIAEVKSTGELDAKRVVSRLNHTVDPWAVYQSSCTIIGESETSFYIYENFIAATGGISAKVRVYMINKASFIYTAIWQPDAGSDQAPSQNAKLLTITDNNIAIFVTYYIGYAATDVAYNATSYSNRYVFIDMVNNTIVRSAYPTIYPHQSNDVYVCSIPSALTLDLSNSAVSKFYSAGATKTIADGCRVVRYTVKNVTDTTENPVGVVCTLAGLPGGVVIPVQNPAPSTTYNPWSGSRSTEIGALTVISNSKEFIVFVTKPFDTYTPVAYAPIEKIGITVFQVNAADSSILNYKYQLLNNAFGTGQYLTGLLKTANNKTLVFYNEVGFVVLKWNDTSEAYVVGNFNSIALYRISLDLLGQIFVEGKDNNIYIFNINQASYIDVKFENDIKQLEYTGTPLQTNLLINAYSALNIRMVRTVNLVLENAVFTSGGGTARQFTTSSTADTSVGITISTPGTVNVIPYVD